MSPTDEELSFGALLRRLAADGRWSAPQLATALTEEIEGYSVSDASVRAWMADDYGPRRRGREVVEVLDDLLNADGELLRLRGYTSGSRSSERLDRLEAEVREIRQVLEQVVGRALSKEPGAGEPAL